MKGRPFSIVAVVLEECVFEDYSDEDVLGVGGELELQLLLFDDEIEALYSFKVFGPEVLKNLFDDLCFNFALHFHFLLWLFLHMNILYTA